MRSNYDAVIEIPVEHSRLARRITSLLEALEDGAHVALGSRYVPGGRVLECGSVRRLTSRGVNGALRRVVGLPVHDVTARVRAFRREAVGDALLRAHGEGRGFGVEVLLRCRSAGLRLTEVPVTAAGPTCATNSLVDSRELIARVVRARRLPLRGGGADALGVDIADPATATAGY
jgi:dolichol-phosphate mannosyltransferase